MHRIYIKSLLVFILICALFSFTCEAYAQSKVVVLIDYYGDTCETDGCYGVIDGGETYACVEYDGTTRGNWNDGNQEFFDPLPEGVVLTHVAVELFAECIPTSTTYSLNGAFIDTVNGSFGPCECTCPPSKLYSSESYGFPGGFPNYNYGGMNTLNLSVTADDCGVCGICAYAARVTLTYSDSQIPTVSQSGMAMLAILIAISAIWMMRRKKRAN